MKKSILFLLSLTFLNLCSTQAFASENELVAIEGVTISNRGWYIEGKLVADCVENVSSLYSIANNKYAFAIGCDNHLYSYSKKENQVRFVSNNALYNIVDAHMNDQRYIELKVHRIGGAMADIATNIFIPKDGADSERIPTFRTNTGATVSEQKLYLYGKRVSDVCFKLATPIYSIQKGLYVFALGCDHFLYSYSVNEQEMTLITKNTEVDTIYFPTPSKSGYVDLLVQGTGGSNYQVPTVIFAGETPVLH